MDGYALSADDPAERFTVAMEIAAGQLPDRALQAGECARIFTGAALPAGATQVIPQEDTRRDGAIMIPLRRDGPKFVRLRGAEAQPGDILLRPGTLLGGAEAASSRRIRGVVAPRVMPSFRGFVQFISRGRENWVPPRDAGSRQDAQSRGHPNVTHSASIRHE
jgi:molybdopterin molybdotransferase